MEGDQVEHMMYQRYPVKQQVEDQSEPQKIPSNKKTLTFSDFIEGDPRTPPLLYETCLKLFASKHLLHCVLTILTLLMSHFGVTGDNLPGSAVPRASESKTHTREIMNKKVRRCLLHFRI